MTPSIPAPAPAWPLMKRSAALGKSELPSSLAPSIGHVSLSASILSSSSCAKVLEGPGCPGSSSHLAPGPRVSPFMQSSVFKMKTEMHVSVCPEAPCWAPWAGPVGNPSGCCRGGCSSDFPALLSFSAPKFPECDRPLGSFSTRFLLPGHSPLLQLLITSLVAALNSHQALNANHVAQRCATHVTCLPFNFRATWDTVPSLSPVFEAEG